MLIDSLLAKVVPLISFLSPAALSSSKTDINLVPLPLTYTTSNTAICLSSDFTIKSAPESPDLPADLLDAIASTDSRLKVSKMKYLSPTGGQEYFTSYTGKISPLCRHYLHTLYISLTAYNGSDIMAEATLPADERPAVEQYTLDLPLNGKATIVSPGALGAFRGLTSFENLFYTLEGKVYAPFAPYHVVDKPAFGWRAVLLDTSRHYFSVPSILKILDVMATVKLNVFHWHITDSDSWPLDLKAHPKLASEGAHSPPEVYTEEEVKMIIDYAGHRGIDTLLEIDTPGHTASIAPSHPSHIACFESRPFKSFAHQPPAGQLRFADEQATLWTAGLLKEAASLVKGRYFSTGGDEINQECMLKDKPTIASLKANGWTLNDALDQFTEKTHAPIREAGMTPVVWQEMVLDHGDMSSLKNDTIVDIWVNSADAKKVLDRGYRIVHASADYFYLDCGQGGWIGEQGGGNSWCDPFKSWSKIYSFDPYRDVKDDQRHLILGGQTSLWTEQTDETNLEPTLWPRAAALAEVFWSGLDTDGRPRSAIDALPRMHDIRYRMVARGVMAAPLQPHWCALRPGACVMSA